MRPIRLLCASSRASVAPSLPALLLTLGLLAGGLLAGCVVAPETHAPSYDAETIKAEEEYQRTLAFKKRVAPVRRLQKISWPIMAENVPLCGAKVRHDLPLIFTQRDQVPRDSRAGWTRVFGDTDRPVVFAVLEKELESQVQEGQEILEFSFAPSPEAIQAAEEAKEDSTAGTEGNTTGRNWRQGLNASFALVDAGDSAVYAQELATLDQAVRAGGTLSLFVAEADGTPRKIQLTTREVCDYPVHLNDDDAVNAFADGKAIYINQGLMKQAPDDLSLAIVVGHELAHNTRDHIPAKITNTVIGGILGGILGGALDDDHIDTGILIGAGLGSASHSQDFENEADYVGLYHTARAGWDVSEAGDTWRWFGSSFPGMIGLRRGASHPSSVERYLNVDKTAQEIAAKLERGEPLIPGSGAGDGL